MKGFRQRDPLSRYLFTLVMDVLSLLINKKIEESDMAIIKSTLEDFSRCSDFGIGKLESLIFPALIFKQCPISDSPAGPASAPAGAEADGPGAADDMQF
ncbi:hypothetical protein Tco_1414811 [Tanacetum coccineum]